MASDGPNSGALISPRLTAKVHQALGRATNASVNQAVLIGEELIAEIQSELENAHRNGSRTNGGVTVGGGGAGSTYLGSAGGGAHRAHTGDNA